jgi:subtilisin family serine protease
MKKYFTSGFVLFWAIWGVACQSLAPVPVTSFQKHNAIRTQSSQAQLLAEKIRNKKPLQNPPKIGLDKNWFSKTEAHVIQDLTPLWNKSEGFQIQAQINTAAVFQETFVKTQTTSEYSRSFSISNPQQRYTLLVERAGKGQDRAIEVNINGTDWIKPSDLTGHSDEVEVNSILLQAQNSLRIRLKGKAGTSFKVSLYAGGEAGTLLRRRGRLGKIGESHQTHVQQNDSNIFDPANPQSSLGGLTPYQGDQEITLPGLPGLKQYVAGSTINDEAQIAFESGNLILEFADPQVGLTLFQEHYGAEVVQQVDTFYKLKLDLNIAPLQQLPDLLRFYNQHIAEDIQNIQFSSLASMQTFTILFDALQRFPGQIKSIELNMAAPAPAVFPDTEYLDGNGGNNVKDTAGKALPSWWQNTTRTFEAWDYSIGTGVTAAWIDYGYNVDHAELKDRMVFGKDNFQSLNAWPTDYWVDRNDKNLLNAPGTLPTIGALLGQTELEQTGWHGHGALMTAFAQRQNKVKNQSFGNHTSGIAPNAKVIPYHASFSMEYAAAVKKARDAGVKLIGFNQAWKFWHFGSFFQGLQESIIGTLTFGNHVNSQIEDALKENRIVIVAAHNYHENIQEWTPVNKHKEWNDRGLGLIVVGAVQGFDNTLSPSIVKATPAPTPVPSPSSSVLPPVDRTQPFVPSANYDLDLKNETDFVKSNGKGSNYGPDMVWAPGDSIFVSNRHENGLLNYGGTSAATPFVTGVVALMLSRNPDLTPTQVRDILLNAKGPAIKANPGMAAAGVSANLLDVQKVMENPALWPNTGGQPDRALTLFGLVQADKRIRLINQLKPNLPASNPLKLLKTVSDDVWDNILSTNSLVKIQGWNGINAGNQTVSAAELEVLKAEEICDVINCTNPPFEFNPKLNDGKLEPDGTGAFFITLKGDNLIADLRSGTGGPGKPDLPITLSFVEQPSSPTPSPAPSPSPSPTIIDLGFTATDIVSIKNDGTEVKVRLLRSRITTKPLSPVDGGTLPPGNYKIAFKNTITNKRSNDVPDISGKDFGLKSTGGEGQAFGFSDLSNHTPYQIPTGIEVYLKKGDQQIEVQPDEVIGFAVKDTVDLSQLEVEVAGQIFNLQQILHDASSGFKYGSFKLPSNLPPGVQDVIIRLVGTPGVTLEQALKVLLPSQVNIRMSRNILLSTGQEEAEVYITVRDAQGNPVPDGSRFFVKGLASDPVENGRATYNFFDYSTNSYVYAGYYVGYDGAIFPVQNGRIRFRMGISTFVNPFILVDPWPIASSPSTQLRVCNNFSGLSYGCQGDLGPESPAAGRFFLHHVDSIAIHSKENNKYTLDVKDILGNPIPVGHVLTFEGAYSPCLLGEDGSGEGGSYARIRVTRPGQIVLTYRNDISCNRAGYLNVFQGNASGYPVKGSPLLLGP